MDLTPLFDLRDRLKAGAVAGTSLLSEDFRLSRALEAMAPLESASPVFGKIGQSVRALLEPDCPDRAAALLSALALCDAVIVTQGVSFAPGELEPLPLAGQAGALQNLPYSVLQPLLDALTGSGGGRYNVIVEMRTAKPELFRDYRVLRALVGALGDSYADLAEWAKNCLLEEGPELVPLLKDGFDPQGKKDMQRRLSIIEQLAGAGENDFYLSLLETAEKDLRSQAIYALRLDEKNAETLVTLAKTEKGGAKKQAHWALAKLSSPIAWEYWQGLAAKKPEQAAEYMELSEAAQASRLIAEGFSQLLSIYEDDPKAEITKEIRERLQRYVLGLPGKSGPEICNIYRRGAALKKVLDRPVAGEDPKKPMWLSYGGSGKIALFSQILIIQLIRSLKYNMSEDLAELAGELYKTYGSEYLTPYLFVSLVTKPAAQSFELAKPLLSPNGGLFKQKLSEDQKICLDMVLQRMAWSPKLQKQVAREAYEDPSSGNRVVREQPLAERLDFRWYEALLKFENRYEDLLMECCDMGNQQAVKVLQTHFHAKLLAAPRNSRYLYKLKALGWTDCRGFAVRYFQNDKNIYLWEVAHYFNLLPGAPEDKAKEAEALLALIKSGKVKCTGTGWEEELNRIILQLQRGGEQV